MEHHQHQERAAPPQVTPTSEPYGTAFDAAHAANVAKIDAMQDAQQKRMMGLSVGLRRASAGGFVMPAAAPSALNVRITGTPAVGFTVTGHYAYFDPNGDPEGATLFAWLRDGVPISGATAQTYTLVAADSGHTLAFPRDAGFQRRADNGRAGQHRARHDPVSDGHRLLRPPAGARSAGGFFSGTRSQTRSPRSRAT